MVWRIYNKYPVRINVFVDGVMCEQKSAEGHLILKKISPARNDSGREGWRENVLTVMFIIEDYTSR